jgi:hypothetical protein
MCGPISDEPELFAKETAALIKLLLGRSPLAAKVPGKLAAVW